MIIIPKIISIILKFVVDFGLILCINGPKKVLNITRGISDSDSVLLFFILLKVTPIILEFRRVFRKRALYITVTKQDVKNEIITNMEAFVVVPEIIGSLE